MRGLFSFALKLGFTVVLTYVLGPLLFAIFAMLPIIDPLPFHGAALAITILLMVIALSLWRLRVLLAFVSLYVLLLGVAWARLEHFHVAPHQAKGLAAVVTGSSDGIGAIVAEELAVTAGYTVFLHGRSLAKMDEVSRRIAERGGDAVVLGSFDFASFSQVKAFADAVLAHPMGSSLHLLVVNAALARVDMNHTIDGYDALLQVNCLAGGLLQRIFEERAPKLTRVVHVSSLSSASASRVPSELENLTLTLDPNLPDDSSYGRTKLCQVVYAQMSHKVRTVAVHPGSCYTGIGAVSIAPDLPFPLYPKFWWKHYIRPSMLFVYAMTWLPARVCADAILWASLSTDAEAGEYYSRFRPMPWWARHPLSFNKSFVQSWGEKIVASTTA